MTKISVSQGALALFVAMALTGCPSNNTCNSNSDCSAPETCSVKSGLCTLESPVDAGGTGGGQATGGGAAGRGTGGSGGGGPGGGPNSLQPGTLTNTGGETCGLAVPVDLTTVEGDTTGKQNDYALNCAQGPSLGPDAVYQYRVLPGQRLAVVATPELATSGNQYDLSLYFITGPPSQCDAVTADGGSNAQCLAASANPLFLDAPETATYLNESSDPADVFVIVDSYWDSAQPNPDGGIGRSGEGKFSLKATLGPPKLGDACTAPQPLISGETLVDQDLTAFYADYAGLETCRGSAESPDAVYALEVPPGELANISVRPDPNFNVTLSIVDGAQNCGRVCVGATDALGVGGTERYNYKNSGTTTKTLLVVVDGYRGSTGTFAIGTTVAKPPDDDVCDQAIVLSPGFSLTSQTITNYSNDYTRGTNCVGLDGPDRTFAVTVPDGERLVVRVTPSATANASVSLVDGPANCGEMCVASASSQPIGVQETLVHVNRTGASRTYQVVVDFTANSTGTFDIVAAIEPPPAGDVCLGAPILEPGSSNVLGSTNDYSNDYPSVAESVSCSPASYSNGFDRVYQVTVPSGQRGELTVTPVVVDGGPTYNPTLNFFEGSEAVCGAVPRVCVRGFDTGLANEPEVGRVFNTTPADRTFFAVIDSQLGSGSYTVSYNTSTPVPDDTCTTNQSTLSAGTQLGTLAGFVSDYSSGLDCYEARGADRVYKVRVEPNQRLTSTVTAADGGIDAVLSFIPGPVSNCDDAPIRCVGAVDNGGKGVSESGSFTNSSTVAQDVFVVVADFERAGTGPRSFSITTSFAPPPLGETCLNPQPITVGMLANQSLYQFSSDVRFTRAAIGSCSFSVPFQDRFYSLTVPAGKTVTVKATPSQALGIVTMNILDAATQCDAISACLARGDGVYQAATASYQNTTGADKSVLIQVASTDAFALDVRIP
jgi:hypothetical protein